MKLKGIGLNQGMTPRVLCLVHTGSRKQHVSSSCIRLSVKNEAYLFHQMCMRQTTDTGVDRVLLLPSEVLGLEKTYMVVFNCHLFGMLNCISEFTMRSDGERPSHA